jgi:hypothetical protein
MPDEEVWLGSSRLLQRSGSHHSSVRDQCPRMMGHDGRHAVVQRETTAHGAVARGRFMWIACEQFAASHMLRP